ERHRGDARLVVVGEGTHRDHTGGRKLLGRGRRAVDLVGAHPDEATHRELDLEGAVGPGGDLREGGELALRRTATVVDDAGAHHDTERLVGREARTADPNELPVDEPVGRRHLEWMALRV